MDIALVTTKQNRTSGLGCQGDGDFILSSSGGHGDTGGVDSTTKLAGRGKVSVLDFEHSVNGDGADGVVGGSFLDDASISARKLKNLKNAKNARTKRNRRCFHRVMSGLQRGGRIRFLTLTSAPQSGDIHRHFKALVMRLKRRGLLTGYIQVPAYTKSGLVHKHILFRGSYLEQAMIAKWWSDLHGAKVVDIRAVRGNKRLIAGYMASYMSNQSAGHYSWDWGWVWRGFVRDWQRLKHSWLCARHGWDVFSPLKSGLPRWDVSLTGLLLQWRWHLETGIPPP